MNIFEIAYFRFGKQGNFRVFLKRKVIKKHLNNRKYYEFCFGCTGSCSSVNHRRKYMIDLATLSLFVLMLEKGDARTAQASDMAGMWSPYSPQQISSTNKSQVS
ncbi:unnamed protein product [Nezara viridula]|uniref:Uncharacterized protein n=1 Tax=Nezara viridula TaxID=85310 RepID=A0A9P0HLG3_NEZVI|nr:unnamed protein product [Nezara viridula]